MLRRLIAVTAATAGLSAAAAIVLAMPALAKGPSQASITGPGLARPIVLSGNGEPGEQGPLAVLAGQTGLFDALFGAGAIAPTPPMGQLRTPPSAAVLGPRYTVIYTVPGVTPQPGEQFGRIRQDLYPGAAGGPVIYTPSGQNGFSQPLQVTGWLRAGPQLARILARLGVRLPPATRAAPRTRPPAARPAAAHHTGSRTLAWLIAAVLGIAAAALAGTAWRHRRKPAIVPDSDPRASGPAAGSA